MQRLGYCSKDYLGYLVRMQPARGKNIQGEQRGQSRGRKLNLSEPNKARTRPASPSTSRFFPSSQIGRIDTEQELRVLFKSEFRFDKNKACWLPCVFCRVHPHVGTKGIPTPPGASSSDEGADVTTVLMSFTP